MMRLAPSVVAGLSVVLAAMGVAGQSGTPEPFPVAPHPAECIVSPRPLAEVVAVLSAAPEATTHAPEIDATPFVIPPGKPADAETAADVETALRQVFACTNAGDFLRIFALFSDDFLRDFFAGVPIDDGVIALLGAPAQPLPADQQRIIRGFGEVRLLADGRAGVTIILDEPDDPRHEEPDYAILKRVDGHWLVDEIHEDGGAAEASPIP